MLGRLGDREASRGDWECVLPNGRLKLTVEAVGGTPPKLGWGLRGPKLPALMRDARDAERGLRREPCDGDGGIIANRLPATVAPNGLDPLLLIDRARFHCWLVRWMTLRCAAHAPSLLTTVPSSRGYSHERFKPIRRIQCLRLRRAPRESRCTLTLRRNVCSGQQTPYQARSPKPEVGTREEDEEEDEDDDRSKRRPTRRRGLRAERALSKIKTKACERVKAVHAQQTIQPGTIPASAASRVAARP